MANESEDMLRRAFVDHGADYIVINSRRQARQIESACYGVERGWLTETVDSRDVQSQAWVYRLTPEGREHFFGAAKERSEG